MLYQTARHSRAQLCGPGAVLRTGRQDLCGSRCSVGIRQKEERPPRAPLSQLLCRCGAVAADQVCALVSCKTGLCSVLLSQSPGHLVLRLASPLTAAWLSLPVERHLSWCGTMAIQYGPVVSQTAFSFSPLDPGVPQSAHILGTTWSYTGGRMGHSCPLHVHPGNGCPHAQPPSAFLSLWARMQLLLHCMGLCGHLEPHPLTHMQASAAN